MIMMLFSLIISEILRAKTQNLKDEKFQKFYRGTLRLCLVLLKDLPEFFVNRYIHIVSELPYEFVQLRNMVTAAYPKDLDLPSPFLDRKVNN